MAQYFTLGLLFIGVLAVSGQKYSDKFAGTDITKILSDESLYKNYIECLKTGKNCTPEGQALREILPEAIRTKCSKCSDSQRERALQVIKFLVEKKRDDFIALGKIYDPNGTFQSKFLPK